MSDSLPDPPLLSATGLACIRGGRSVFDGVAFTLGAGDALLLRGPNGSGKSSLLRILAGFLEPAAGELSWAGEDVLEDPAAHRARVHYVGHADAIKSVLTSRENLAFTAALAGTGSDRSAAALDQALEGFDLTHLADVPAQYLSAGQKRRLALARLLAVHRILWLLDEPAVGLDAANRAHLEQMVRAHRDAGGVAVIATHGDVAVPDAQVLELGG